MTHNPSPVDVRIMNAISIALVLSTLGLGVWVGISWLTKHSRFAVRAITVVGDTQFNNGLSIRANVLPKLRGNFLTLDLHAGRAAFEQLPWVRKAVLQRDLPNKLRVRLEEHRAVAFFGVDSESKMVNSFGEVFEANQGDVTQELPRLIGPESQAKTLLETYRALENTLATVELSIEELEYTPRGSWRATLDNGATLELGRDEPIVLAGLLRRFAGTLTQTAAQMGRRPQDLESADLRYPQGYSLKLRGVTTQTPTSASTQGPAAAPVSVQTRKKAN
jgi:cell division protein FtsQ